MKLGEKKTEKINRVSVSYGTAIKESNLTYV